MDGTGGGWVARRGVRVAGARPVAECPRSGVAVFRALSPHSRAGLTFVVAARRGVAGPNYRSDPLCRTLIQNFLP